MTGRPASRPPPLVVHASVVAWHGRGVLLRGPPGAGKSALALRLLRAGAFLVADDLVALAASAGGRLLAGPPARAPVAGLIEARGLGIFRLAAARRAALALAVDLGAPGRPGPERLPEARSETLLGVTLPRVEIDARGPDAVDRVLLALCAARAAA
jgi:HPr kinase/phosphorylase